MAKLIVDFLNFANTPKIEKVATNLSVYVNTDDQKPGFEPRPETSC